MNNRVKLLLFGIFGLICSFFLYYLPSNLPFFIYLKIFFPVNLIAIYYVIFAKKDTDMLMIFNKLSSTIGKVIVISSLPAFIFPASILYVAPYFYMNMLYNKLGVPTGLSLYLSLITPIALILISGSIYKKIKG